MLYVYRLATPRGETTAGEAEGPDDATVRARLEAGGAVVLTLRPALALPRRRAAAGDEELAVWVRELAVLLRSGVPMVDALGLAGESSGALARMLPTIVASVKEGRSLSKALEAVESLVPPFVTAGVRAGERSGDLPGVLERMARLEGEAARTRLEMATRMLEPMLMVVMGSAVAVVLVAMFLPIVELAATL